MKKLVLIIIAAMASSFSFSQKLQEQNVPALVKTAFQKKYPDAKKIKWEKERNNFEAEFEITENEYSVLLDASGNILETELEIKTDELPANVKDYLSKNYNEQKIKEAAKITDAKGIVTYEAEIKGQDLLFDSDGNFIKIETDQK